MQERPLQMGDGADVTRHAPVDTAVERVADNRVADCAEMDAYLMCATGVNGNLAQRQSWQVKRLRDSRDRLTRPPGSCGHLLSVHRIPADWSVEGHVMPLMGGFEDKTRRPLDDRKRLVITGLAVMGGVEVKN